MAHIDKRINKDKSVSYRIRISNGFKADGKPNIISKTWKPKNNLTEKEIKKELDRVIINFEDEIKYGKNYNEDILFSIYSKEWLENKRNNIEQKTFKEYVGLVNRLNEKFENTRIISIKSSDVSRYFNELRQLGANKNNGSYLSENTIRHIYIVLNDILECACDVNIIIKNPLKDKAFVAPKVKNKEKEILQEEDIKKFISLIQNENIKWRTIMYMLLSSGMRIGELVALEWKDINFNNNEININKSITYISGIGIIEKAPKTNKSKRIISIPIETINLLKEYKLWQTQEKYKLGDLWHNNITLFNNKKQPFIKKNDKLFTQYNGLPMSPDTISKWTNKFCKRNNMKFTPHSLRHTYVSLLIKNKLPVNLVSESVGHSNSNTTLNIYSHLFNNDKKIVSNVLSNELNRITNKKQD